MNVHDPRRLERFDRDALVPVSGIAGFGIWDKFNERFMGFQTSKGFISVWNEPRKAKLAFSYHTKNTIDERATEFEIREITSTDELYKGQ